MSALSLYQGYYKALAILRRVSCLSIGISLTTCISSVIFLFTSITILGIIIINITEMDTNMSIIIKELRDRTKLSQRGFAEKYGIPVSTLRKWEQGETTPAPYVISMLARQIKGSNENLQKIECKDGSVYYYDSISSAITDIYGNSIIIKEELAGVKSQNLPLYVKDLFEAFYEIQNKFNQDIVLDKKEDIIWS